MELAELTKIDETPLWKVPQDVLVAYYDTVGDAVESHSLDCLCKACALFLSIGDEYHRRQLGLMKIRGTMSESTIKAAREKAWELELASGDDLQEEFAALLSSFPPDDAFRIFAGGFFEQGYEAAQKVADKQTADLRSRLEQVEICLQKIQDDELTINEIWGLAMDAELTIRSALKELQEATK